MPEFPVILVPSVEAATMAAFVGGRLPVGVEIRPEPDCSIDFDNALIRSGQMRISIRARQWRGKETGRELRGSKYLGTSSDAKDELFSRRIGVPASGADDTRNKRGYVG